MNLTGDQRYFLSILGAAGFVRPDQVLPLLRINEPQIGRASCRERV